MLEYYKLYVDDDIAIYKYILEGEKDRVGVVKFDRHEKDKYESVEILKKAKDDVFAGWSKLRNYLFKMNEENDFKESGLIAWY